MVRERNLRVVAGNRFRPIFRRNTSSRMSEQNIGFEIMCHLINIIHLVQAADKHDPYVVLKGQAEIIGRCLSLIHI